MSPDAQRKMMQLEREVRELRNEIVRLKSRSTNAAQSGSHVAILQAVGTIAGRTESSGIYDVSHGSARLFDLIVKDTADPWKMQVVKDGATIPAERTVELGNMWSAEIAAGEFLLATSYGKVYLHGAQECGSDG